jgi:hypothetical protein
MQSTEMPTEFRRIVSRIRLDFSGRKAIIGETPDRRSNVRVASSLLFSNPASGAGGPYPRLGGIKSNGCGDSPSSD